MAEEERLTKKERRARARAERKQQEAEQAQKAKRQRLASVLVTVVVLAGIVAVVATAVTGGGGLEEAIVLSSQDAEQARAAAGCEVVADQPLADREHFPRESLPPADQLYPGNRPTNSGSHLQQTHPLVTAGVSSQLDERELTHNLEHGSIIAWYDPEKVDGGAVGEMESWSEQLNNSGFTEPRSGTGIFVSPYTDPGITSGKAVAFRAWGFSMDCDEWNETAANSFVLDNYGTHGRGPERNFAPFPSDQMAYSDQEVGDTPESDAPLGEGHDPSSETPDASASEGSEEASETTSE